jgi:hypothetical protein
MGQFVGRCGGVEIQYALDVGDESLTALPLGGIDAVMAVGGDAAQDDPVPSGQPGTDESRRAELVRHVR